ncbi:hypothetical protein GPK34_00375 [Secundilactobacillus kimchicus]|uniref:hypothetical protein n=1 Tax=Secundilactobacillus kimchicus TaxID=528209 RepID=UPI001C0145EC|nr:hypothetical protein [Secundilactobacillus kimchicus]MBT9670492.1 hypothetical protein [Secundilactobacillus kimchicus]
MSENTNTTDARRKALLSYLEDHTRLFDWGVTTELPIINWVRTVLFDGDDDENIEVLEDHDEPGVIAYFAEQAADQLEREGSWLDDDLEEVLASGAYQTAEEALTELIYDIWNRSDLTLWDYTR